MNEKLITRLVASTLGILVVTAALAGQISSTSTVAREVITGDGQSITAPRYSYRFLGDIDARAAGAGVLQVQFTLSGGAKWQLPSTVANDSLSVVDGVGGQLIPQGTPAAGVSNYQIQAMGLSADGSTLWYTLNFGTSSLVRQPIVSIAASSTASHNPTITRLKTLVGTVAACDTSVRTLPISFKHYVALNNPSAQANDANATPDEHLRAGAKTSSTLVAFPTNIGVSVTGAPGSIGIDSATGSKSFTGTNTAGTNTWGVAGTNWQAYISPSLAILGSVSLTQNATAYDTNLLNPYLLQGNPAASGIKAVLTASLNDGNVEASALAVKVSASQGFAVGASLFLASLPTCDSASKIANSTVTITSDNASGPVTLSVDSAHLNGALGTSGAQPLAVCYAVPGTTSIPASSFNVDDARLYKAAPGVSLNEQDNSCFGQLGASLSTGNVQRGRMSAQFLRTPAAESSPAGAAPTPVTLLANAGNASVQFTTVAQRNAAASRPASLTMPLGQIHFSTKGNGDSTTYSLYVAADLGVNGFWVKAPDGTWVNLASAPYGGAVVLEGSATRLDFKLEDNGIYDLSQTAGTVDVIGAPAYMPPSAVGHAPTAPADGRWF